MHASEKCYLRYRKRPPWSAVGRFWTPHPENVLFVYKPALVEAKRIALNLRNQNMSLQGKKIKSRLLAIELDNLVRDQATKAQIIDADLQAVEAAISQMQPRTHPATPDVAPQDKSAPTSGSSPRVTTIAIVPGDPQFSTDADIRAELLPTLYMSQHQWLPSYGPWFIQLTENAMQRRVFPRELRGTVNFQNSTSLKLITQTLSTICQTTSDFFSDPRHLTDTQAALCLINAYYSQRTSAPPPTTMEALLADLPQKIDLLITHLKHEPVGGRFNFTYANPQERTSLAPLNRESRYPSAFFQQHQLYRLFDRAGLFANTRQTLVPGTGPAVDLTYAITARVFGEDIPPFFAYQWNLRTGLKALEILIMVYLLLEFAQVTPTRTHRRLDLIALLGSKLASNPTITQPPAIMRKGQLFGFICKSYVTPILTNAPHATMSFLFPGIVLAALEARSPNYRRQDTAFVNLTGSRFNEIFDVINQQLTFQDPMALLQARTALRLEVEEGLNALLSHPSPGTFLQDIVKTQFGGLDDYDRAYFVVLGCLPVALAVA
ncbi:ORF19 [Retroperitoneal fibromatosis-associated herpesvirus]|uniref:ORF19 n=1 Tax=Retroperitoneal fibromatosis-associated herpesvirus TaxID=111469 RepID=U5NLZ1_9GAMA|nr:ORF19 [Retroperitoneal fibromatosis-associated herpesvirus]AGY30702.1 ORF19 [Retroperitoneal fibromatosis-associated herpesvirus]